MQYLCKVEGRTRRDRVRNSAIRTNLGVKPAESILEGHKLRWFGYLLLIDQERTARKTYETRVEGRRPRGRPREESVKEAFRRRDMDWIRKRVMVQEHDIWSRLGKL
ncbi:uncharacterized protein [Halyomorpha halys]|uniref:uncharacterized protein n=1 Tax=Halyomorpha halys TaxID=286706 RepID=UPI0034D2C4E5